MIAPSFLLARAPVFSQGEKIEKTFIQGIIYLSVGGNSGGGGDDVGMNFLKTIRDAIENLRRLMPEDYQLIQKNNIEKIVSNVKIIVVDENLGVRHKGYIQNSVAVNLPQTRVILVNRTKWNAINDMRMREAIAIHEVLSLEKIESTGKYSISAKYLHLQGSSDLELITSLSVNQIKQIKTLDTQASNEKIMRTFYSENDCSTGSAQWRGHVLAALRKKINESNDLGIIDGFLERVDELRLIERHCMRNNIKIMDVN